MAWHRSCMKTGSGPAPTPAVAPEFVVEHEDITTGSGTRTWTVMRHGLYFLEVTGAYNGADLSVTSLNTPYFNHTMSNYIKNRYMLIDLDVGDVVTYAKEEYRGIFHAIRFTNCSFDSIIEESSEQDNWTEYTRPTTTGAYFMYGSCCGRVGNTQIDDSVASSDCNTYAVDMNNGSAKARIIACTDQSASATIKMYGYDNGGSSVVCLKMHMPKVRDDIELIFQENVHDSETPSVTYTAYEDCKVLAINFDTKMVGTNGHYTVATISTDGTVLDYDTISHSFGDGNKRDVECAFYLIDVHVGDTITFTNASQYSDTYGCHLIFKMDDILALNVKFDSSHYDNTESNTKTITGNINRTLGIVFELSNQSNYNLATSSSIGNGKYLSNRKGIYYSYSAVIGTGDIELTCDNTNAYTTKAYFAVEI